MGITNFWNVIGKNSEEINLFRFAEQHWKRQKRPLRIAVDFAYWYARSVGEEAQESIRDETKRNSQTIIKNSVLYLLLRCASHGIQFVFVFDGLGRPVKRGKQTTHASQERENKHFQPAKDVIELLGVPYINAPGEAEAQCAAMESEGLVDAVWTQDGDAFAFGARTLIRHHYVEKERKDSKTKGGILSRDNTNVEMLRRADLQLNLGPVVGESEDRYAILLYALLVGCDYTQGAQNCGDARAREIIKQMNPMGIRWGTALVWAYQGPRREQDTAAWRDSFAASCKVTLPVDHRWPSVYLGYFLNPEISPCDDGLKSMLEGKWRGDAKLDLPVLRDYLHDIFNFSVHDGLRWILPFLLTRKILSKARDGDAGSVVQKLGLKAEAAIPCHKQLAHSCGVMLRPVEYNVEELVERHILMEWGPKLPPQPRDETAGTPQRRRSAPKEYKHRPVVEGWVVDFILHDVAPALVAAADAVVQERPVKRKPGRPSKACPGERAAATASAAQATPVSPPVSDEARPRPINRPRPSGPVFVPLAPARTATAGGAAQQQPHISATTTVVTGQELARRIRSRCRPSDGSKTNPLGESSLQVNHAPPAAPPAKKLRMLPPQGSMAPVPASGQSGFREDCAWGYSSEDNEHYGNVRGIGSASQPPQFDG